MEGVSYCLYVASTFTISFLEINVVKTKEMVIDYRKSKYVRNAVTINGIIVKGVDRYKYFGVVKDNQLSRREQVDA